MPEDRVILSPTAIPKLTVDQIINYIEERFAELRKLMATKPPPPTNAVSAMEHLRWRNRFLIFYGQCVGALQAAQAFGHIDVPQFELLKTRLLSTMTWKMADVEMGNI